MKEFIKLVVFVSSLFCIFSCIQCQENAVKNLSPSLLECYDGDVYKKWNLLPHNIDTFVAILRKIEDSPGLNMDLRYFSSSILHRFRQDGIVRNPKVKAQVGVMPYAPLGQQFFRHAQTLRVIPGNAINFPNNSISTIERCTLHSMLSSSIDIFERGDESEVCKIHNYAHQRYGRSIGFTLPRGRSVKEDIEMFSTQQLEIMTKNEGGIDPNLLYPALPPNHPYSARVTNLPPRSHCPIENGIIKTPFGTVSTGSVLAGIAAGLEPQMIKVGDLVRSQDKTRVLSYPTEINLDNKFLGTLAGDLAEVALVQGPQQNNHYNLGVDGNWNSTSQPLYYFLNVNENLQMTAAEIRGDIDGLILASQVPNHYSKLESLRLSQIFDMYYSNRGFFNRDYRGCNRHAHTLSIASSEVLIYQTYSAAIVLSADIATATFSFEAIEKFAVQAVKDLLSFIPSMNNDSCETHPFANIINEVAVHLTIILDTTWPYDEIQPILAKLLGDLDISKFNSNFTIISAHDGTVMINSSNSVLDFQFFNSSHYNKYTKGLDLPRAIEGLKALQLRKLNEERQLGWGGGKSDVVLIIPYKNSISEIDKEYCTQLLKIMREEIPDSVILFLSYGTKDQWSELVLNFDTDIVPINIGKTTNYYPSMDVLQSRIRQVPRRLINSQCGANYEKVGKSQPVIDFIGPNGIIYYRIHPNYFFSDKVENLPTIKIRGSDETSLNVCFSRELIYTNESKVLSAETCTFISSNTYTLTMTCEGVNHVSQCKPYYISISSNATSTGSYTCKDPKVCRYPNNIKYTISYENLQCKSGANSLFVISILILSFIQYIIYETI